MTIAYWNQWDYSDILSLHGCEENDRNDDDDDRDDCQCAVVDYECHRCHDRGCNYCLMLG